MSKTSNNIELADTKEKEVQEVVDYSKYEEAHYMYETPETGLFSSAIVIEGLEFASMESLKKEIKEQYSLIYFKEDHKEEEFDEEEMLKDLIVRNQDEIVICKEGVFGWDGLDDDYEYIGEFDIRKIHRKKCVEILEDRVVFKGEEIKILRNGHYDIEHEEVIDVGSGVKIEIFTIIKGHSGEELTIPNNPGLFRIYEVDLALINYIDKYKF